MRKITGLLLIIINSTSIFLSNERNKIISRNPSIVKCCDIVVSAAENTGKLSTLVADELTQPNASIMRLIAVIHCPLSIVKVSL